MNTLDKKRFDTRLPAEQKEFFEYAARLGGFRSLTEFILFSAQEQANKIIDKHNIIVSTKEDQELFFDPLMNPPEPNENLREAYARYATKIRKRYR